MPYTRSTGALAALLSTLAVAAGAAAQGPGPLTLDDVLERSRPAPEGIAVEAELAAAAREIARSHGRLADGPQLGLEAGPRRAPEGTDADLALTADLPLAADRPARRAALEAYRRAAAELPAAAGVEAGLALRLAYVEAWRAAEALALAERDLATAERWLEATAERVAAGAEAPYEATLVAAETETARQAVAAARERRARTWAELRARAEVGETPRELREPSRNEGDPGGGSPGSVGPDHRPVIPSVSEGSGRGMRTENGGTSADGSDERASGERAGTASPEPAEAPEARRAMEPRDRPGPGPLARAVASRAALESALVELEAAREASRWSLGASLAREGEEEVARFGFGVRLPLPGQTAATATARDAALAEIARRAELDRAALGARLAAARERAAGMGSASRLDPGEVDRALAALDARLAAGKDRPSQVLTLRRQLLGALAAALEARAATLTAAYEIQALTPEATP